MATVTAVRGTLTAFVVVLLVTSGAWAGPVGAAAGLAPGGPDEAVGGSGVGATVTTPALNETVTNTTDSNDSTNTTDNVATVTETATNTTDATATLDSANTTDATDDATTVTVSGNVDGETTNVSIGAETGANDGLTAGVTANSAVSGASVETAVDLQDPSATREGTRTSETRTGTPASTETSGENASTGAGGDSDGARDSGTGGDVPATTAGAVLVGFGAAAATLLARRSATVVAFAPDLVTTVSRLPSPLAQLWRRGREWLPRVLAAVGYSRYDDSDPLTHGTRAELYDLIAESPGTYLSELSEQADVPTSTVRHHLEVLVREGVVTTANVRGKRRYFSLDAGDEALAAALSDDASAAVIECLAEEGPASVSAIAEDLDRDVSTVSHHLGRLAEDDLVEREREGRSVYNDLSPEVEEALESDGSGRSQRRA